MCRPQTATMGRSEEGSVLSTMALKESISITTISASCAKKFAERARQPGEIAWQSIVGVAVQFLCDTIDERRFTRKKGSKSLEFRGDFNLGTRGRGRVRRDDRDEHYQKNQR